DPGASGPTSGAGVTSTASAPRLVASMLELLELSPGLRVLEIGAGSGYDAALLREVVGRDGSVCSINIDGGLVAETKTLPARDVVWLPLDDELGRALRPEPGDRVVHGRAVWELAYLLALEDRRAGSFLSLVVEDSSAAIDTSSTSDTGGVRIGRVGPEGEA